MSTIEVEIKTKITLELTAGEAGALSAICGYNVDAFLRGFYQSCGKSYIQPYESNLKSLFNKARMLRGEVEKVEAEISKLPKIIKI